MTKIVKLYSYEYIIRERHQFWQYKTGKISVDPHEYIRYKDEQLHAEYASEQKAEYTHETEFDVLLERIKDNSFGYDEAGAYLNFRLVEVEDGWTACRLPLREVHLRYIDGKFVEVEVE